MSREPELMSEVEKAHLDTAGLTSVHSVGSRTDLLERGWTLSTLELPMVRGVELEWVYS